MLSQNQDNKQRRKEDEYKTCQVMKVTLVLPDLQPITLTHSLTHFPLIEQEKERKSPPTTNTTSSNNSLALTPTINATQRKKRKRVKKLVTKMFVEEDGSMGE